MSKAVHVLVASTAGVVTYIARPGSSLFSWHPTLMMSSFGFLMTEGVLAFSRRGLLPASWNFSEKRDAHVYIEFISDILLLGGFAVIYYNKELNNKPHFQTPHAIIGATAISCALCTHATGVMAKYSAYLKKVMKPSFIKIAHVSVAFFAFTLGSLSIVSGMNSMWFTKAVPTWAKAVCVGATAFSGSLIGFHIFRAWQGRVGGHK